MDSIIQLRLIILWLNKMDYLQIKDWYIYQYEDVSEMGKSGNMIRWYKETKYKVNKDWMFEEVI